MGGIFQPGGGGTIPLNDPIVGGLLYVSGADGTVGEALNQQLSGLYFNRSLSAPSLSVQEIQDGAFSNSAALFADNTRAKLTVTGSGSIGNVLTVDMPSESSGGTITYNGSTAGADLSFINTSGGSFFFDGTASGNSNSIVEISAINQNGRVIVTGNTTGVNNVLSLEASGSTNGPIIRNTSSTHASAPMNFFNDGTGLFAFAALTGGTTQTRVVNNNDGGAQDFRVVARSSAGGGFNNYARTTGEVTFGADTTGLQVSVYDKAVVSQIYCPSAVVNFTQFNSSGGDFVFQGNAANAGLLEFLTQMAANGATATVMSGVGPAGANANIQEWLQIKNAAGVVRYIPCW